jgi:hypothetical protein
MIRTPDIVGAVRSLSGRQVAGALLFALTVSAVNALTFIQPILHFAETISPWILFLQPLAADAVRALCLLVAIVAADRAVDRAARDVRPTSWLRWPGAPSASSSPSRSTGRTAPTRSPGSTRRNLPGCTARPRCSITRSSS